MKLLRNLLIALLFTLAAGSVKAAEHVYLLNMPLSDYEVTKTTITVSSASASTVLAANGSRIGFQIQLTTCSTPATTALRVWYDYDGFVSSAPTTMSYWLNSDSLDEKALFFQQPAGINHVGTVKALQEPSNGQCYLRVIEWFTRSESLR